MAAINTPSSDPADLLQTLSLNSQDNSLEVHENQKKFGSYAGRNSINSLAKPYERSTTPVQDYNGLNMYYLPGAYSYYFGAAAYDDLNLWNDYSYINPEGANLHSGLQQRQTNNAMSQSGAFMGRSHFNDHIYGHFGNTYRGGSGFGLNYYNPKYNWRAVDNKYPSKGRTSFGYYNSGNENKDSLNELSKGPRVKGVKSPVGFGSVKLAMKGHELSLKDDSDEKPSLISGRDQYNKDDFPESFKDVRFFVIKSYSEDDIHKSIKYSVWASTPNGNKKLDAAYQEAKAKPEACPVFLLFSVNASGQFVGLAEMVGPVDFNKSMDFWQQDKWTGCFPVKWHIVKDVPNNLLKHITLENNENKPVTNSRDTQEVKHEQGVQVVKIFKSHLSKTSVLDDFDFYEGRQKALQEKKSKRQQYQKQMKNDNGCGDDKLMKSLDADAAAAAFIEGSLPNSNAKTLNGSSQVAKEVNNGITDEVVSAC